MSHARRARIGASSRQRPASGARSISIFVSLLSTSEFFGAFAYWLGVPKHLEPLFEIAGAVDRRRPAIPPRVGPPAPLLPNLDNSIYSVARNSGYWDMELRKTVHLYGTTAKRQRFRT